MSGSAPFREIRTTTAEQTESEGRRLGESLGAGDVVYLSGDLGAGKTAFARGLAEGLGVPPAQVASPTFSIVNEYAGRDGAIAMRHLDLYRLDDLPREMEKIGVPDALEGAPVAVEWPGSAIRAVLPPTVHVEIERMPDGARRIVVRTLPRR